MVPEDEMDSTMLMARRPSDRCLPRLNNLRAVELSSEASSVCEPMVDIKVQGSNVENSDLSM